MTTAKRVSTILCRTVRAPCLSVSVVSRVLSSPPFFFFCSARFLPLLHEALSSGLAEGVDDVQASGALQLGEGWMHIHGMRQKYSSACRLKERVTHFCPMLLWRPRVPPDDRNLPPLNRIGDPDDILASVRVEGGKVGLTSITLVRYFLAGLKGSRTTQILAETYQAMPSYRICTAHGVTQLTEGLASKLRTLLYARAREESLRNPR